MNIINFKIKGIIINKGVLIESKVLRVDII